MAESVLGAFLGFRQEQLTHPAPSISPIGKDASAGLMARLTQSVSDTTRPPILPAHIEATVEAIARLHADQRKSATPFQTFIVDLTARAGRPSFVALLTVIVVGWIAVNSMMILSGRSALDDPPFAWLELLASLAALYMTVMILSTQRRDDELASHREQLTLELAILGDQKSAKIIQLLEELRRDIPVVRNRIDPEAVALSSPADPQAVLEAIQSMHQDMTEQQSNP